MRTPVTRVSALASLVLAAGVVAAPLASAAPAGPAAEPIAGSVAVCLNIPLGPVSVSVCL